MEENLRKLAIAAAAAALLAAPLVVTPTAAQTRVTIYPNYGVGWDWSQNWTYPYLSSCTYDTCFLPTTTGYYPGPNVGGPQRVHSPVGDMCWTERFDRFTQRGFGIWEKCP